MKRQLTSPPHNSRDSGFTLIELLIAIAIIAILVALILPTIAGVRRKTQEAAVSTEITQLDQAITSFKTRFGVEPPSSLTIPTSATGWMPEDRQKITRIWDQFDFTTLGGLGAYPTSPVNLNGAECLVFFLGGVDSSDRTVSPKPPRNLIGFSKNPRTPWNIAAENRDPPFYDRFTSDRLVDVDGDDVAEFLDSLPGQTTPYLFFSSQGKSYRRTNSATAWDDFDVHGGMNNTQDMSSVYVGSDGKTPQRSQGYQLISPGFDGLYGIGGVYTDGTECKDTRSAEADNITNFSGGRLSK